MNEKNLGLSVIGVGVLAILFLIFVPIPDKFTMDEVRNGHLFEPWKGQEMLIVGAQYEEPGERGKPVEFSPGVRRQRCIVLARPVEGKEDVFKGFIRMDVHAPTPVYRIEVNMLDRGHELFWNIIQKHDFKAAPFRLPEDLEKAQQTPTAHQP